MRWLLSLVMQDLLLDIRWAFNRKNEFGIRIMALLVTTDIKMETFFAITSLY